ncbi:HlyD family secretion protein [Actinoplanes sp. NPDC051343]|jgi:hypothetical protein|uniref:HlyD family secretion protein n=1 Tax=Actinoplanes sp. NPDC051343 TaxID=3363906 RepID=UPI00378D43FB
MTRRSSAIAGVVAAVALVGGGTAFTTLRPRPKTVPAAAEPAVTTTNVRRIPGALQPSQAIVVSGPGRISAVTAQLGDPVDEPLFSISSTTKLVTLPMSPTDAGALHSGMAMSITLPNGSEVPGKISAISPIVTGGGSAGADDAGGDSA